MVVQRFSLYESDSVRGTLYICIDESKFALSFCDSVKVEMLLHDEDSKPSIDTDTETFVSDFDNGINQNHQKFPQKTFDNNKYIQLQNIVIDQIGHSAEYQVTTPSNEELETKIKTQLVHHKEKSQDGITMGTEEEEKGFSSLISSFKVESNSLDNSENNTSDQNTHACSDCHDVFNSWKALRAHRQPIVSDEYSCDECCEVFQFKAYLEVHKKSNHGSTGASVVFKNNQYWYKCDECETIVKSLVKLQAHTLIHFNEGTFKCCFCPQKFVERNDLKDHIKRHKETGMIKCRKCNTWCENASALGKHKLECREVKCYICDVDFPNRTSRNQHYKDFHSNDILKCHLCTHLFSSQKELDNHIAKHSLCKKTQCPICGQFFSRLKRHMLSHKKRDEFDESELYFCDKCPSKFTNQVTFSRHRKNHSCEKLYKCTYCPRKFKDCAALRCHIRRHSSNSSFSCEVCGERCALKKELESHMLLHLNDNIIFSCHLCSEAFLGNGLLENHMQMKHPESFVTKSESVEIISSDNHEITATSISTASSVTISDSTNSFVISEIPGLYLGNTQYEVVVVEK